MSRAGLVPLQWPSGGLHKRSSYQRQPPFTTPDCQNVRPLDIIEGRARGGSRPGLGRTYGQVLGTSTITGTIDEVDASQYATYFYTSITFHTLSANLTSELIGKVLVEDTGSTEWPIIHVPNTYTLWVSGNATGKSGACTITIGDEIRMLATVQPIGSGGMGKFQDRFKVFYPPGQLGPTWSYAAWTGSFATGAVDGQGTYDGATGRTTVDVSSQTASFYGDLVGQSLVYDTSGTAYAIASVTDTDTLVVTGDSSAEANNDTYVVRVTPNVDGVGAYNLLTEDVGAVRDALTIDTSEPYTIMLRTWPTRYKPNSKAVTNENDGHFWDIYLRMDDAAPTLGGASADGIRVRFEVTDQAAQEGTLTIQEWIAGVAQTAITLSANVYGPAPLLEVIVDGNAITVHVKPGTSIFSLAVDATPVGKRVGFGLGSTASPAIWPSNYTFADTFTVLYTDSAGNYDRQRIAVASTGGKIYRESPAGTLEAITTNLTLSANKNIQAVERAGKVYIADYDDPVMIGTDGNLDVNGTDDKFSDDAATDWTTIGINAYDYVLVISDAADSAGDGTYKITAVGAAQLTISPDHEVANDTACSYRIERAPKIYDPDDTGGEPMSVWFATAAKGAVPTGCPLIARYRDRLCLAGHDTAPHVWYMSRQADPLDWLYFQDATDAAQPVAGTSTDAGVIAAPITAMISRDDYMLFGCDTSSWMLRGDPALGGVIDQLSSVVGMAGKAAWAPGPSGETFFLSRNGLFLLPPGGQGIPLGMSLDKLPRELRDIDPSNTTVLMAYDHRDEGLHIFLTPDSGGAAIHYWVKWEAPALSSPTEAHASFWPVALQPQHQPTSIVLHEPIGLNKHMVLLGSRTGYIYNFDEANTDDAGISILSHVAFGPLPLGMPGETKGCLQEVKAVLSEQSGLVDCAVFAADTAEEVTVDCLTSRAWRVLSRTVSSYSYSATTGETQIALSVEVPPEIVGAQVTFATSGTSYPVVALDTYWLFRVTGDASGEAASDTVTFADDAVRTKNQWVAGLNHSWRPRTTNAAVMLKVGGAQPQVTPIGASVSPWALEGLTIRRRPTGKLRKS